MSRIIEKEIPCPHCGVKQPFSFYEVINVKQDPELKQKVLNASVFDMTCNSCHAVSRIGYPMMYHDPDHNAMIFMTDESSAEQVLGLMGFLAQSGILPETDGNLFRAVHQPPQLAEKIFLLDEGLDDRVIELMKVSLRGAWMEQHADNEPEMVLIAKNDNLVFLLFPHLGDLPVIWPFNRDIYEATLKEFCPFFNDDMQSNLFVDKDWVMRLLTPDDILQ